MERAQATARKIQYNPRGTSVYKIIIVASYPRTNNLHFRLEVRNWKCMFFVSVFFCVQASIVTFRQLIYWKIQSVDDGAVCAAWRFVVCQPKAWKSQFSHWVLAHDRCLKENTGVGSLNKKSSRLLSSSSNTVQSAVFSRCQTDNTHTAGLTTNLMPDESRRRKGTCHTYLEGLSLMMSWKGNVSKNIVTYLLFFSFSFSLNLLFHCTPRWQPRWEETRCPTWTIPLQS